MRATHILLCVALLASVLYASDHGERKAVRHDDPEYPVIAAKMSLHGTVKLRVWIAPDGSVRRVEYIGSPLAGRVRGESSQELEVRSRKNGIKPNRRIAFLTKFRVYSAVIPQVLLGR